MNAEGGAAFDAFVSKWRLSAGAERANKDSFLNDLCAVLGVPAPNPTTGNAKRDDYVFEKAVVVAGESGRTTKFIDLYKRGSFVLEAKQGSESGTGKLGTAKRDTPTWNVAMNAAFGQAIGYATALDEAPPFVIVTDIGYCFDVYASFDGTPRYRPFPNALDHRFYITRLAERADILRKVFLEPLSLDPSKVAVEVTREVAVHLANLTKRLERAGHAPQLVADFLMRCIFTMFAEDVGLLPDEVFTKALTDYWIKSPRSFPGGVEGLWRAMNEGTAFGFFDKLLHFNGGLFKSPAALPLDKDDLGVLLTAARCSWNKVEPAIFGALFEGALDKRERHNLGAHFTPRAYVERLVRPTIEEPVREDWGTTQAKIRALASSNRIKEAKAETRAFLKRLSEIRVLDPACGTGNFLYVSLDLLKAIEDEAFALLLALEGGQTELCLDAPEVTPKQFLGIEINPRAKAITELVLWIGYLQWHFRTKHRGGRPREPVLEDYRNVACRDAVLAYDSQELRRDAATGKPISRWDGVTMKKSRTTGTDVPDEAARVPIFSYENPRRAEWPQADYVVGNPPFIGNWRMRAELGDGYTEALRATYDDVPESAEFVMYWWDRAARLVRAKQVRRAGFITTTTITQKFNRRVVQTHMEADDPVGILFAIADHPWTTAKYDQTEGGAEVRTAMTVIAPGNVTGRCGSIMREREARDGEVQVDLSWRIGTVNADLSIGANVPGAGALRANMGLSCRGVSLHGSGFIVTRNEATKLGLGRVPSLDAHIRPYVNGQDLASLSREALVIDLLGLSIDETRSRFPAVYQRLHETVRPEREQNARDSYRKNWWLFGEPRKNFRPALAGLRRYIGTPENARRRYFVFLDGGVLPDNMVVAIAVDDAYYLGVLSSRVHVCWALAAGGRLGIRHDPRYNKTRCFEPFPFPEVGKGCSRIRKLAEEIDSHRKRQQAIHPKLTLTKLYKALDAARAGQELDADDRRVWEEGLGATLLSLHLDLDAAVLEAYGWPVDLSEDQLLARLVALNTQRAEEERAGTVRWLRPDYQEAQPKQVAEDEAGASTGPGVRKSASPRGPSIAPARAKPVARSKAREGGRSK